MNHLHDWLQLATLPSATDSDAGEEEPVDGATIRTLAVKYVAARQAAGRITAGTASESRHILYQFADAITCRSPSRLAPKHIEAWLASIAHLAPGTRRTRFSVVRRYCAWLHDEGHARRDPARDVPAPKVPRAVHRALTAAQVRALLAACPDSRARCIIMLGVQLGLRRAEVAGLQIGDVDLDAGVLFVTGKGGHQRFVPITAEARAALLAYLADSPACAGPLIRGDRRPTDSVKPVWVGRLVSRLCWSAGIKSAARDGVSFHAARHTAASDVYQSSRDVLVVRDMLGHVSLNTTQVYVRGLDLPAMRDAMEGRSYSLAA